MTRNEELYAMVQARKPEVFAQDACHVFADALQRRFGYVTFGIKKTTTRYAHVYCMGSKLAVDVGGKQDHATLLEHWQQYEGVFSLADSIRLRDELDFSTLITAGYEVSGLLCEKRFLDLARLFADEHITANLQKYD